MSVESSADPGSHVQGKRKERWKKAALVVISLVLAAVLAFIEASNLQEQITIRNQDFFGMAARSKLLPGSLPAWVNGFYPVGIPLLLRIGLALGLDVVRSGQVLSFFGGVLCLYGGGLLAWHLTRSHVMTFFTMACLLSTGPFLLFSGFEGTDMLAAGLQVLALAVLARDPRDRRIVLLAGIINGLGYLVRYTAMVTLAVCLLYLLAMALYRKESRDLWIALAYGLGFLGGALPQLVPSLLVKGNPLYQTQVYHIWIRLYANSDFVRINWRETPVEITLWELFWLDPARFSANWWREFTEFWAKLKVPLMDQPLAQLTKAGFLFAVMDKHRLSAEHRALLSFFGVGIVGILSIFNIETRFLLLMAPVFVVCALYLLWRLLPTLHLFGRFHLPINVLALAAVLGLLLPTPWELAHTKSSRPGIVETSNMLHAAGARTGAEILTAKLRQQDVASPTRDHFTTLFQLGAPDTVADLRRRALDAGYRFVIYHSADGLRYYPEYEELLWPGNRPAGYTPIWTSSAWAEEDDRFAAYRIEPDDPSPQTPSQTDWAGGVSLLGYDLVVSADQPVGTGSRVGVYLYWRATEPLTESLKVFVHLLDPQGNIVAQHDSKPAVWTYDTRDWQPGEAIVDFHCVKMGPVAEGSNYTVVVGLYNESTGVRRSVSDDPGQPARDHIELTRIRF